MFDPSNESLCPLVSDKKIKMTPKIAKIEKKRLKIDKNRQKSQKNRENRINSKKGPKFFFFENCS